MRAHYDGATAIGLGLVERVVCGLVEGFQMAGMFRVEGDADAAADVECLLLVNIGLAQRVLNAQGNLQRLLADILCGTQQYGELVATQAGQQVMPA